MASSLLKHPQIDQINLDLATMSQYAVAKKYGLTRPKVSRYKNNEWREIASNALNAPNEKRSQNVPNEHKKRSQNVTLKKASKKLAVQYQERQELAILSGEEIVASVQNAFRMVDDLLRDSVGGKDLLSASRELRESAKSLLDLYMKADSMASGSLIDHPDWQRVSTEFAEILRDYPDALDRIMDVVV
jgi:hypothetical protein